MQVLVGRPKGRGNGARALLESKSKVRGHGGPPVLLAAAAANSLSRPPIRSGANLWPAAYLDNQINMIHGRSRSRPPLIPKKRIVA